MASGDIERVIDIAQTLPQAPRWTREAYEAAVSSPSVRRISLVAEDNERTIMGFAISLLVGTEAELETIGVAPDFQRKGVGRMLLDELLSALQQENVTKVLLEVRDSNWAAQQLYRFNGFTEIGRRSSYYADPKEDAVLMEKTL